MNFSIFSFLLISLVTISSCDFIFKDVKNKKPNILLISVDDLNDWIGVMGGHTQAITPNIDKLASNGILFTNANCQSPICNPSRASLMTSLYPSSTGIYFLNPSLGESPIALKNLLMPDRFLIEGYDVSGAGKLFHNKKENKLYIDNYWENFGKWFGPLTEKKLSSFKGHKLWDWGGLNLDESETEDSKLANWAVNQISRKMNKSFWIGVGFFKPHVPLIVPKKWFDLYPLETVELPKIFTNDIDDISEYAKNLSSLNHVAPSHHWVISNKEWKPLVRSYLACISFVDHQIGKVLNALEKNNKSQNTFVVLFSDNGFHLGEKERWAKRSLWGNGSNVPLIISGPGLPKGKISDLPVQLLDIYPTLLELTGLKLDPLHEGKSLIPIMKSEKSNWPHLSRTSFGPGNYAIVSRNYRFIQYNDGSEEFYDRIKDPHEWFNLIEKIELTEQIKRHRNQIPKNKYKILGEGSSGHKSYSSAEKFSSK